MRTKITVLLFFSFLLGIAQPNPQTKAITEKYFPEKDIEINTPAFQKKKGFTKYAELMVFLDEQVKAHPDRVSYELIGKSQKGLDIPMLTISNHTDVEKLNFWIQAGLHGNEPASTEGVLYLIERLLNDPQYAHLLDKIDIRIIPMANIDGYEKQDRYSANGLDLNRDQTKLMAPESVVLKNAFSAFNADVAMDFHEYRPYRRDFTRLSDYGVTSPYDVMFLYSGNLNVPRELRKFTKDTFVSAAKTKIEDEGMRAHDYFSSSKYYGELQFTQGSVNSRSSATSYALTNCVSTLIEVRGVGLKRTSFKRRVFTTFTVAMSYLNTAYSNAQEVKQQVEDARKFAGEEVVIKSVRRVEGETVSMIDVISTEIIEFDMVVRDAWFSKPKLTRTRPEAYLILPGNEEVIEKLKILGLTVDLLKEERTVSVESYTVSAYSKDMKKYEGVHRQTVETEIEVASRSFPKGTYIVKLNQPKGNLATEVMEPEATNSFVSFDVIQTALGMELPYYRYLNSGEL